MINMMKIGIIEQSRNEKSDVKTRREMRKQFDDMRYMTDKIAKRLGVELSKDLKPSRSKTKDSTRPREVETNRKESQHKKIEKEKKKEVKVVKVEPKRYNDKIKGVDKKN